MSNETIFSAPIVMDDNIMTVAIANTTIQILALHFKTLIPSKLYIGSKLNATKKLLTEKSDRVQKGRFFVIDDFL